MSGAGGGGLVVLASARSCGVTTAALALAAAWPRPRLVCELDPAGGSLAPRLGLSARPGLLDVAAADPIEVGAETLAGHLQVSAGVHVLLAPAGAEAMAAALAGRWGALAGQLAGLPGIDVLADCGRLGPDSPVLSDVAPRAGVVVMVCRASVEGFVALHHRLAALPPGVAERSVVVLVGEAPGCRRADFARAAGLSVAGVLADDWRGAALAGAGALDGPRFRRSALARSAAAVAAELSGRLGAPAPPLAPARQLAPASPLASASRPDGAGRSPARGVAGVVAGGRNG